MYATVLLVLLGASQSIQSGKITNYHDRLLDYCNSRAGIKCCRASVHSMREEQARLKDEEKDCPAGLHPMSLACPASFTWCSFRSVEEVRGKAVRGKKLK